MKAVLIVMLSFSLDGGATATTVEFNSMEACEAARKEVVRQINSETDRNWGRRNYIAVCAKR